jgi:hypothetical protein
VLAKRKGAFREGWSEGSVEQNYDLTNRNRIAGGVGWTSCPETTKSISIKTLCRRSDRRVVKAIELTPGDLCRCPTGLGRVARRPDRGREVSSGHSSNEEAGGGHILSVYDAEGSGCEGPNGPREGLNGEASRRCNS